MSDTDTAANTYTHPAGTPVVYISTVTGEPVPWVGPGTVTGTWMTQDEPGEEPYRVYSIDLQGGGNTVWSHDCTHYDFAWRDRPDFRTDDIDVQEVWCTDLRAHTLTDLQDLT